MFFYVVVELFTFECQNRFLLLSVLRSCGYYYWFDRLMHEPSGGTLGFSPLTVYPLVV